MHLTIIRLNGCFKTRAFLLMDETLQNKIKMNKLDTCVIFRPLDFVL